MKRLSTAIVIASVLMISTAFPAMAADLNDFVITDFEVNMELGRDASRRSTLKTTEKITAGFSSRDINRGLERAIPKRYDGHTTNVVVESVTDENGVDRVYSTYDDDSGNLVVRMADMDVYVHGIQTYVLTYTQRDVTKYYQDTTVDEFYWDINGTDWRVSIDRLDAMITLEDSLSQSLTGGSACYKGVHGSSERCQVDQVGDRFYTQAAQLDPGENITISLGFQPGTFAAYEMTTWERFVEWWKAIQVGLMVVMGGLLAWVISRWHRTVERSRELKPIPPEYIPPHEISVTTAAKLNRGRARGSVMSAQLLDLAVRRYIRLYEVKQKTAFHPTEYEIEITKDVTDLRAEEQELLRDSFGSLPAVGQRLNLKSLRNSTNYQRRTADNDKKLQDLVRGEYALYEKSGSLKKWLRRVAIVTLMLGIISLSPFIILVTIVSFSLSFAAWPLTDKGLRLKRYLEGLRLYIEAAETERIRMLQSPEGAEKTTSITSGSSDRQSRIKLYERLLPYAVMFGLEKEWTKQLGNYYEQEGAQPDWYSGVNSFSAAAFANSIDGLSQAANNANSSSSSSGGSGGGGFSGGGGGGGGGGGV